MRPFLLTSSTPPFTSFPRAVALLRQGRMECGRGLVLYVNLKTGFTLRDPDSARGLRNGLGVSLNGINIYYISGARFKARTYQQFQLPRKYIGRFVNIAIGYATALTTVLLMLSQSSVAIPGRHKSRVRRSPVHRSLTLIFVKTPP